MQGFRRVIWGALLPWLKSACSGAYACMWMCVFHLQTLFNVCPCSRVVHISVTGQMLTCFCTHAHHTHTRSMNFSVLQTKPMQYLVFLEKMWRNSGNALCLRFPQHLDSFPPVEWSWYEWMHTQTRAHTHTRTHTVAHALARAITRAVTHALARLYAQ